MEIKEELGFYHFTKAGHDINNLPEHVVDEMCFSVYEKDTYNSRGGEFTIRWYELGRNGIAPRLEAFSDSWSALAQFPKLLEFLDKNDSIHFSPEELTIALLDMSVVDKTFKPYNG